MRIRCPECDATFEVPDTKLHPGRSVRCARCQTVWIPLPFAAEPTGVPFSMQPAEEEEERDYDPLPSGADRMPQLHVPDLHAQEPWPSYEPLVPPRPELRETERSRLAVMLAWVLSLAVLGGMVGAAYIERTTVMRLWPPSERVYQLVGLRTQG